MLSEGEKRSVDRLAFCMNITRSGVLANITTKFLSAVAETKAGNKTEKELVAYLADCRRAVKQRGAFADES